MSSDALILAHGQPSDPDAAEADMARLGAEVAGLLPGWCVRAATLAAPGALDAALSGMRAARVLPFFMADGWFTRTELPRRLTAAGATEISLLPAFGLMPEAATLAADAVSAALNARAWRAEDSTLVLAAHGSGRSRAPAEAAENLRRAIAAALPFAAIRLGFIEEAPSLEEVARNAGPRALCLPLFVANWGHAASDVPAALSAAGFGGPCLPPLGTLPEVPALLAGALARGARRLSRASP